MSYLDVQGKLNYSPQYDSMLTKFLRGFITRPAFISDVERRYQFALSAFNGVKIGNKGLKYREVQGALYTYTEVILNMLGQYVFLTSDSPRSYMMTTKRLEVDDLFIKDSSKPRTSIIHLRLLQHILNRYLSSQVILKVVR